MNHSLCSTPPSVLKATVPPPQYRRTLSLFHCGTGIVGAGNGSGCTAVPSEPLPCTAYSYSHFFTVTVTKEKLLHFTAYMNVERVLSLSHLPLCCRSCCCREAKTHSLSNSPWSPLRKASTSLVCQPVRAHFTSLYGCST